MRDKDREAIVSITDRRGAFASAAIRACGEAMDSPRKMERVVRITSFGEPPTDIEGWRGQSYEARIAAVEEIRRECHGWDDESRPRVRRVYRILTDKGVRYLLVGGYAVGFHGRPRYTKDMDVWIGRDEGNAARMVEALEDFGFEPGTLQTA